MTVVIRSLAQKLARDTRLSKTQFTCCTAIYIAVSISICLSLFLLSSNFRSAARIVEISLRVAAAAAVALLLRCCRSTSETAIALNLPFYSLTHFWPRNAATATATATAQHVVEHVRSALELAGTSRRVRACAQVSRRPSRNYTLPILLFFASAAAAASVAASAPRSSC